MPAEKPLNILQVVASLQGGAAQHVYHLSMGLIERGHQVVVAAANDNRSLFQQFSENHIPVIPIDLTAAVPISAIVLLRNTIKRGGYSHIHMHGHRAGWISRMALMALNRKPSALYTVHGYHPVHYRNKLVGWNVNTLERKLAHLTDVFICVSESARRELTNAVPHSSARCVVIENGISLDTLLENEQQQIRQSLRAEWNYSEDTIVLGTVARLHWQKGIDRLIKAYAALRNDFTNLGLFIVGDGPDRAALEQLIRDLGLNNSCRITGHRMDVRGFYAAMDLFVLASYWEGLPLTILEAWKAGVPVVATDVPGNRDLLQPVGGASDASSLLPSVSAGTPTLQSCSYGYLAEDSLAGIVHGIKRALEDNESWPMRVKKAQILLKERYTIARMVSETERVYYTSRS